NAKFSTPNAASPRTILVFSADRVASVPETAAAQPSSWAKDSSLRKDLVIVTSSAFISAAQSLRTARESAGVRSVVVPVEQIYDNFGFGIRSPESIKAFFKYTRGWKTAPRFAVLVGDASMDPRNYFGLGPVDFVPTKLAITQNEKTASDDWFTDFNGDWVPDIPIGRLPARTTADATAIVSKIISRNPIGAWASRTLFVADVNSTYDFENSASSAA